MLANHRFSIHPTRWGMAAPITLFSAFNSVLSWIQSAIYGRKIQAVDLKHPPIFIVGHWRSGTTHLHELLVLDEQFSYPTTYACFSPHHYLISEWLVQGYFGFLLPKQRPMDNMAAGWNHPQEDEFALCNLGVASPYTRIAFPNDPPEHLNTLNMERVPAKDYQKWCRAMERFVKMITFKQGRRVILKSPTHTGRIQVLSQLFPGAKFVHITRDPLSIFPSTRRLWKSLAEVQSLQVPCHDHLDEYIFEAFERMYRGFEEQRKELSADQLYELRYEDLVKNPIEEIRKIYSSLGLQGFDQVQPKLIEYMSKQKDYAPNKHELEPEIESEIRRRWSGYFEKYGY